MVCKICSDSRVYEINQAIISGGNLSKIAKKYNLSYNSLYGHSINHLPKKLVKVFEKKELDKSSNIMQRIDDMLNKAQTIFDLSFEEGKHLTALKSLDAERSTLQLLLNISAQMHAQKQLELEILKQKTGGADEEKQEQVSHAMKILSTEELQVLNRLAQKMSRQNSDIVIKEARVMSYRSHKEE